MKTIHSLFTHTRLSFATGLLTLALSSAAVCFAADAMVKKADKSFMKDAYQAGLAEIKFAELAGGKTANPDVKAFAAQMATDHAKANDELKALADTKKVELPTDPSLIAQGKLKLADAKSGADFDKAYAADMVSDHEKVVAEFEKESSKAVDPDVKAFATKTLPVLQGHLSMAQDLQNKVGK
jgi:putative membrane protein